MREGVTFFNGIDTGTLSLVKKITFYWKTQERGRGPGRRDFLGHSRGQERIMGRKTLIKEYYMCIKL